MLNEGGELFITSRLLHSCEASDYDGIRDPSELSLEEGRNLLVKPIHQFISNVIRGITLEVL